MIFFLFGNGPVEAFIAIFSQIKTLCFYTLFGQSILEIQFFWYFLYAHNLLLKNKKQSDIFSFSQKYNVFIAFFGQFPKNQNQAALMPCLKGFLLLFYSLIAE